MKNIIILIIAGVAGVVVGIWLSRRRNKKRCEMREEMANNKEGLEKKNQERADEKEKRKERILTFMQIKAKTSNDEVQRILNVSDASAENYLDELEKEGKIKQVGKTGRFVEYELNG